MAKQDDNKSTSWEKVAGWYDRSVGESGHYYHQTVVLPGVLRLLQIEKGQGHSLLDIACGQGVLARHLPEDFTYVGLDASRALISAASRQEKNPKHSYQVADVTKPFPTKKKSFSHAAILLALQNLEFPDRTLKHLGEALCPQGRAVLVLNHPCFRIPRQSSWGVDEDKKLQYRRIDSYMTPARIPITMHPGKGKAGETTYSFHHPLGDYVRWCQEAGLLLEGLEEWTSPKQSTGKAAKMENRARKEIPLFVALVVRAV